ncbi:MAG: metal-dependent transcriptional regulator [Spirochaetes bacterium]|nr:metal-dependent transcriptional regulator [Spirochaetota bacterium]
MGKKDTLKMLNDELFENTDLSSHMEDYLERIAILSREKKVVRVKDIAKSLGIKMPSVTSALIKLCEKGLIVYEKYGYVELTPEGGMQAEKVYRRHSFLTDFFHNVLGMNETESSEVACKIEHHLSPESCRRINRLVRFYKSEKDSKEKWTEELGSVLEERPLSDFIEGDDLFIVRLEDDGRLKKRLLDMGFRKGERIHLVKYAPLRDPLEIEIKGYHISIRVEEARSIIVRRFPVIN